MTKCIFTSMVFIMLMALSPWVVAQGVTTAAISGTITDENGEPLPGANVVAVHTPSGTQYGTATLPTGKFNLPNVRIGGPYTVTVSFVGYEDQQREGINLAIGQNYTVDVQMASAGVELSEVVVSGAANPVLNADRTGAATNVSREQIQSLPTLSRSFTDYVRLTPQANGNSFGGRSGGFNNITVDGALFNNAFGLSGTVGGQTNAQPFSLDAVDQIAVNVAPYDVREGSFTGAGVNVVTRSGTNEFSGSAYYFFRNASLIGKKVAGVESELPNFNLYNTGFRLGGPIIKNKLFFFINGEMERRDDPPTPNFIASRPGVTGDNVSQANAAELDELRQFLINTYGFDPGPYEGYELAQNSDKITARIDWNITNNHKFSIKYNYLNSYRDVNPSTSGALTNGRNPSNTNLPFLGAFYRINNDLNSVIGELNSTFGNGKFANKFQMGFTAFRDERETPTSGQPFPLVDIGNGSGSQLTAFGYEPFSANNILNTDVFQISDNFDIYLGKHTVSVGTYNEFYKFENGFAPNYYGNYQFASLADFYASATTGVSNATRYQLRYSTAPDGSFPLVETRASQLGFYAQDKIDLFANFNLTAGIRVDIPIINSDIARNPEAASRTFQNGQPILTDQVQKTQLLWSPRIGFNWDVKGDRTTQVRGGTGIFTGRIPYVWISNQASNNGVLFGAEDLTNPTNRPFNPDVDAYRLVGATASSTYNLAVTDSDFKFPQVWRSNIAIDQQLPFGIVGTLEAAYTKDINAIYHQNVNLPAQTEITRANGADNRPIYYTVFPNNTLRGSAGINGQPANRIYSNITDAILMRNTNQGYSYFITAQLQKTFTNGFYASAAYTYTDAKSVNDGGSIAQSIWRDRSISIDPNAEALSFSNFLQKHRVVASASYRKEYLGFMGTSVSLFYEVAPAGRFSYTYNGDMNGDGSGGGGNDLIYVPRDQSEVALQDIVTRDAAGVETSRYTAAQQWNDLNTFIEQDNYLSERRGQYAERNGGQQPWRGQLDLRVLQDFFVNVGGKRNTLQVSLDIFNVGNLINSDWGVLQTPIRPGLVTFQGYDANRVPQFTYPYRSSTNPLTQSFQNSFDAISRWQMQLGVRYIFN